jgi:hypothetical protein
MCLGGGSNKQSKQAAAASAESNKIAQQNQQKMEADEAQRQADIAAGKVNIDNAFSSFNDGYYGKYSQDYMNYYTPQLEEQYKDASAKMTAALAGKGLLESTVGIDELADLSEMNELEKTNIASASQDAATAARSNVEKAKTSLYALNESSADPAAANSRAIGEATSLAAPQSYSPIGQVFAAALDPWINYISSKQQSAGPGYSSPIKTASGQGSQKVVG